MRLVRKPLRPHECGRHIEDCMQPRLLLAAAALSMFGTRTEPMRYKIEVISGQQMDMSALGQGVMHIDISATSYVTVTSRDSANQQLLHVVVDSATVVAPNMPMGADPAMMQVANGTAIDLRIVEGKLLGLDPEMMASSPGIAFVVSGLTLLYPQNLRKGVKVGDSWTDTVSTDTTTSIGKGTTTQIRKWKATSKEGDAIVFDNELTGTMTLGGGMADVTGTSTGTSHMAVPPKGPARNATTTNKTSMTMTIAAAPAPIDMQVTGSITVTPIK